jgi:L-cysteine desulfidase
VKACAHMLSKVCVVCEKYRQRAIRHHYFVGAQVVSTSSAGVKGCTHEVPECPECGNAGLLAALHNLRVADIVGRDEDDCAMRELMWSCLERHSGEKKGVPSAFHDL